MKITMIGHLSMLFEEGASSLLMDPLLVPTFGHDYSPMPVELYPPRSTDAQALQQVSAVLVSHEHFDHFNLESLNLLPRSAEIIVGPTMLKCVSRAIEKLGFKVRTLQFFDDWNIGELSVRLYPAAPDTAHWEKRVSQLRVTGADGVSVLVAVDALFGEEAIDDALADPPTAIAIANNAHVPPRGVMGALTNYAERFGPRPMPDGVELIASLFTAVDEWPELMTLPLIYTGGGFRKDYDELGIFALAEQDVVADLARALTGRDDIYGPLPGESLLLSPGKIEPGPPAGWVTIDQKRFDELRAQRSDFIEAQGQIARSHIMTPQASDNSQLGNAEAELASFARFLLLAPLGADLVRCAYARTGGLVFRLVDEAHSGRYLTYIFDVLGSGFRRDEAADALSQDELVQQYTYGVIASLCDFLALVQGDIQIWDLAGVAVDAWYSGSRINAPLPMMYIWWGEQTVPRDTEALLKRQVSGLVKAAQL